MDRNLKSLLLVLAALAPLMAACTQSPETELSWGVNDRAGRPSARTAASRPAERATARTYVYQGDNYAVPAPKPRPQYAPARDAAYQTPRESYANVSFAWPASGQVISGFGTARNGERNDGINIATPMGAPIRAAASGTVTYSGNELKGYGNLLLIKHDGDFVTAYAHAERLLVQRGDFVTKGQIIGYAGETGDVSSPQLHFEIRRATSPVDPASYLMARNS